MPNRGPTVGSIALSGISEPTGWARLEDAVEGDYRSWWAGQAPGYADGKDAKNAIVGDRRSGPIVLRVNATRPGLSLVVCENRCGSNGCEKHRGFLSFGPKSSYKATVANRFGEGERPDTFQERRARSDYVRPRGVGLPPLRYSAQDRSTFGMREGEDRGPISDVAVAVDGRPLEDTAFRALQSERDRICSDCGHFKEACAVVAVDLAAGEHEVALSVAPKTFRDDAMHVALSAVMLA